MRINIRGILFKIDNDSFDVSAKRRGAVNDPIGLAQSKHTFRLKRWLFLYKRKRQRRMIAACMPPIIGIGMCAAIVWAAPIRAETDTFDPYLLLGLLVPLSAFVLCGYLIYRTAQRMDREAIRILERHYGKRLPCKK